MKKLLLALVILVTFGSAVAKQHNGFVLKKASVNSSILKFGNSNNTLNSNQCSQTCWNQLIQCSNGIAPFAFCSQQFIQCIDRCEGAGGLYN